MTMPPPPKPASQRRRRNAVPGTVFLPAEGRRGETPPWPLEMFRDGEFAAWSEMWATPQAVAWERMGRATARVVARYARLRSRAEYDPEAPVMLLAEVRQLENQLGLTPRAMLSLRWEIVPDELAAAREAARPEAPAAPARRIRAVE